MSGPDPSRFFVNTLVENPATPVPSQAHVEEFLGDLINQLLRKTSQLGEGGDYDVYAGEGGVLLTLLRARRLLKKDQHGISPAHVEKGLGRLRLMETLRDHVARAKIVQKAAQKTKG